MNEKELIKLLKQIASADKTPEYDYHSEGVNSKRFLNANNVSPEIGARWCTPREICNQCLRDIESGKLDEEDKAL